MKKITGISTLLLCLVFAVVLILRIWDIHIVSLDTMIRSGATLLVLGILLIALIVTYGAFFRDRQSRYRRNAGKHAGPKS